MDKLVECQCKNFEFTSFRKVLWRKRRNIKKLVVVLREIRSLAEKLAQLDSLPQEVKALRHELLELKTSVNEANSFIKDFNSKIKIIEDRLTQVEKVDKQVNQMQSSLDKLQWELDSKEQWLRMNNVEIKGVTQSKTENLFNIVAKIGSRVQYPVNQSLINFVTRIPTRDTTQPKPIIVCFNNRHVKEDFIAAARSVNKKEFLTPAGLDLGLRGSNRIFVNDHLTIQNKDLP